MTYLWWALPLILVVFLWALNEFLRGRLKQIISGVLALLIFVLVGMAFFISGWKIGIGALVGAFALGNLLRPLALALARRLVAHPDLGFDDYSRRKAERTMAEFGSEQYFERRDGENEEDSRHKAISVSMAMEIPAIAEALAQLRATERDLAALYDRIEVHSLPPRIRKTVLQNIHLVQLFLENSEPYDVYDGTYGRKVSMDTAMRLQLWTHSNPGGKEPR